MVKSAPFPFMATCPKCKDVRSQPALDYRALIQLLDDRSPIRAHCKICGQAWVLSDQDRARLEEDLAIFR